MTPTRRIDTSHLAPQLPPAPQHPGPAVPPADYQYYGTPQTAVPVFQPAPQMQVPPPAAYDYGAPPPDPRQQAAYAPPVVGPSVPPVAAPRADDDRAADVVVFSRPYEAFGEPVSRIRLRRPVAKEIGRFGNPVKMTISAGGVIEDVDIKWDRALGYIAALSDPPLPPSTVAQLEWDDLDACGAVLAGFFVRLAPKA